jgi:hypothetical protein
MITRYYQKLNPASSHRPIARSSLHLKKAKVGADRGTFSPPGCTAIPSSNTGNTCQIHQQIIEVVEYSFLLRYAKFLAARNSVSYSCRAAARDIWVGIGI